MGGGGGGEKRKVTRRVAKYAIERVEGGKVEAIYSQSVSLARRNFFSLLCPCREQTKDLPLPLPSLPFPSLPLHTNTLSTYVKADDGITVAEPNATTHGIVTTTNDQTSPRKLLFPPSIFRPSPLPPALPHSHASPIHGSLDSPFLQGRPGA